MAETTTFMVITDNAFVKLKNAVYLCKGARNAVIMNCNNGKLYMLDKEAYDCLCAFLNGFAYNKHKDTNCDELVKYLLSKELICLTQEYEPSKLLPNPVTQPNLNTVWLELRRACNLKCLHCYNCSNSNSDSINDMLSLQQWKNIIEQLKPFNPNTLIFIGGEPLMYKGLNELIEFVHDTISTAQLVVYSNLTILNDENIKTFKKCNVKAVTSLYADSNDIHDSITQSTGSFEKTISSIKILKNEGILVKANTVIMKQNQHCINQTVKFIKDLTGFKPKTDVIRCVNKDLQHLVPSNIANPHIKRSVRQLSTPNLKFLKKAISGHSCWQGKINISYNGYISPCIMWQPEEKEDYCLTSHNLNDILQRYIKPTFWALSKDNIEICKDCEYRYICHDCRPLSSSLYHRGEICKYNPYTGIWEK